MFETLKDSPEDALHAVMARYNADSRPHKIDLGVGVYREANGASPIMQCVSEAQQIWQNAETTKSYLALRGDERFLHGMSNLVFADAQPEQIAAIQTVGGTGGVRLGIELAAKIDGKLHATKSGQASKARSSFSVFVGLPTWPNHLGICEQLGVPCKTWPYFDARTQSVNAEAAFVALEEARAGDVFVLHGPCHNPTGADLPADTFLELVENAAAKGVVPLIDVAYYGLGSELKNDLSLLRQALKRAPEMLLVLSCSKAFGLYRERTGVLFVSCNKAKDARRVQGQLELMARGNYSMPPSHGAAVAGLILTDDALNATWQAELVGMRARIAGLRLELAAKSQVTELLGAIGDQKGIFSLLNLSAEQVTLLAKEDAIYLPASGRINIAGFKSGDISRFTDALKSKDF